ncbi:unnamed protein product [Oikopleura dioica]|uniref:Uncharacterized protein n=1 Tax=Oikopleura dioica TaxID=34765 RepID=E4Y0H7_OIKDI|nr:unnamed protein product [Oikopleura dioica]
MRLFGKKVKFSRLETIEEIDGREKEAALAQPYGKPTPSEEDEELRSRTAGKEAELAKPYGKPSPSKEDARSNMIPPRPYGAPPPPPPSQGFSTNNNNDPTANLFQQKFVKSGWPKMEFHSKKITYKYPCKKTQKKLGHGRSCAYCFKDFIHNAPFGRY